MVTCFNNGAKNIERTPSSNGGSGEGGGSTNVSNTSSSSNSDAGEAFLWAAAGGGRGTAMSSSTPAGLPWREPPEPVPAPAPAPGVLAWRERSADIAAPGSSTPAVLVTQMSMPTGRDGSLGRMGGDGGGVGNVQMPSTRLIDNRKGFEGCTRVMPQSSYGGGGVFATPGQQGQVSTSLQPQFRIEQQRPLLVQAPRNIYPLNSGIPVRESAPVRRSPPSAPRHFTHPAPVQTEVISPALFQAMDVEVAAAAPLGRVVAAVPLGRGSASSHAASLPTAAVKSLCPQQASPPLLPQPPSPSLPAPARTSPQKKIATRPQVPTQPPPATVHATLPMSGLQPPTKVVVPPVQTPLSRHTLASPATATLSPPVSPPSTVPAPPGSKLLPASITNLPPPATTRCSVPEVTAPPPTSPTCRAPVPSQAPPSITRPTPINVDVVRPPTVKIATQLRQESKCESNATADGGAPLPPPPSKREAPSSPGGKNNNNKRRKIAVEKIRPVSSPIEDPALEIPEVSKADVGKMVLSETVAGTLTGVVEKFVEQNGLGVWSIRYENGSLAEMDDCGELHDDMCAYFELAGNAAAAAARQVRTRNNLAAQEKVRLRVFEDESSVLGRRVCVARKEKVQEGEVTKYVQPTRDGEIEQWRVTYDNGDHEDMESFELVRPLLRYIERRIEQREVQWGHRRLLAYIHRAGDSCSRPFVTLSGICASMPMWSSTTETCEGC